MSVDSKKKAQRQVHRDPASSTPVSAEKPKSSTNTASTKRSAIPKHSLPITPNKVSESSVTYTSTFSGKTPKPQPTPSDSLGDASSSSFRSPRETKKEPEKVEEEAVSRSVIDGAVLPLEAVVAPPPRFSPLLLSDTDPHPRWEENGTGEGEGERIPVKKTSSDHTSREKEKKHTSSDALYSCDVDHVSPWQGDGSEGACSSPLPSMPDVMDGAIPEGQRKSLPESSLLPSHDLPERKNVASLPGVRYPFYAYANGGSGSEPATGANEKSVEGEEEIEDAEVAEEANVNRQKSMQLEKVTRDLNEAKHYLLHNMKGSYSLSPTSSSRLFPDAGKRTLQEEVVPHTSLACGSPGIEKVTVECRKEMEVTQSTEFVDPAYGTFSISSLPPFSPYEHPAASHTLPTASTSLSPRGTPTCKRSSPGATQENGSGAVAVSSSLSIKEGEKDGLLKSVSPKEAWNMVPSSALFTLLSSDAVDNGVVHTVGRAGVSAPSSLAAGVDAGESVSSATDGGRSLGTRLMENILTAAQVAEALEQEENMNEEDERKGSEVETRVPPSSSFVPSYHSSVLPVLDTGSSPGRGMGNGGVGGGNPGGVTPSNTMDGFTASQSVLHSHLSIASNNGSVVGVGEVDGGAGAGGSGDVGGISLLDAHLHDPIESVSPFFYSDEALESSDNRLQEAILSMNTPAQTNEELLWLLRHSQLLYLLPHAAQEEAVAASLRREFSRGETIIEKGAPIRHLYLVVWGAVDAFEMVSHEWDATTQPPSDARKPSGRASTSSTAPHGGVPSPSLYGRSKGPFAAPLGGSTALHPPLGSVDGTACPTAERTAASTVVDGRPLTAPHRSALVTSAAGCTSLPLHPTFPSSLSPSAEKGGRAGASLYLASGREASMSKPTPLPSVRHCFPRRRPDRLFYPAGGVGEGIGIHKGSLGPGQLFGVEQSVFDGLSDYRFRASLNWEKTVVVLLPIDVVRYFLLSHIRFAQGVGDAVTAAVDVFRPIREFCRCVFSASTDDHDYLPLWSIVESYTHLDNMIHTKMKCREVDTGAWGYALNRLPANVTSTFCFNLVHALPPFVASRMRLTAQAADTRPQAPSGAEGRVSISFITTKERRRCTWNLGMEGKTLVLLRDGFTDLLDFLTMICVHILESNKLRGRLQGMVHPPAIDVLDDYLRLLESEERAGTTASPEEQMERIKGILRRMPLTKEEQAGLIRLWKNDTALKLFEVMMHREEYNIRVDLSLSRKFQTNPFHEWALNLRACVMKKIGLHPFDILPDDLYIDVVSSNTHCIKNLLSRFNRKYRKEILAYAQKAELSRLGSISEWHNKDDVLYAAVMGFVQKERPDLKEEHSQSLEESGITVLNDTAMTGLQVDVIPVHSLHLNHIDTTIRDSVRHWFHCMVDREQRRHKRSPTTARTRSARKTSSPESVAKPQEEKMTSTSFPATSPMEEEQYSSSLSTPAFSNTPVISQSDASSPSWAQVCRPVYHNEEHSSPLLGGSAEGFSMRESTQDEIPSLSNALGYPSPPRTPLTSMATENSARGEEYDDATALRSLRPSKTGVFRLRRHFIINMDFAFGAQAEGICRAVFSAFGHRIRSVSIMGKAGGLVGKRGDIQLATHVLMSKSSFIIEDNQDELRNCRNDDLSHERLKELAGPQVNVHCGNVLTLTGTMLQNVKLLRYYQRVWGCVGMEMEGSYFARVMEDFHQQGIARRDIISRFAYYTSDLPLGAGDSGGNGEEEGDSTGGRGDSETLSSPMTPQEGVPPLYAIARGILERILLP